jgi:hypothetical protein
MRKKYLLLVPLRYNDGTAVPTSVLNDLYEEIFVLAGGHHTAGRGRGAYRMKSGEKQVDLTLELWIAIDDSQVGALRALVAKYCRILKQESMFFEDTGGIVDFVEPDDEPPQADGGDHE